MIPVILIHGAWQGAWAWDRFAPLLRESGYAPVAVDLPGNGTDEVVPADVSLDLYTRHLCATLDALGQPSHVIAHSGGGIVASQLAEERPHQVLSLTYVAGMMLPSGIAFADLVAAARDDYPHVAGVGPHLVWSPDRTASTVPKAVAMALFFDDCPPEMASWAADRLRPQPEGGRAVAPCLSAARFGRVPRLYVEAAADRSIAVVLQRRMREATPGAACVTLPSGHAPHVSMPAALCDAVLPFLRGAERKHADREGVAHSDGDRSFGD